MELEQLIYTTCRTGIDNTGDGFQIYSYSQNLDSKYYSQGLRSIIQYKAPDGLPATPSQQEIDTLYPVSYVFSSVEGDKYFVAKRRYAGLDNTGNRYGNIVSQGITFENFSDYPVMSIGASAFIYDIPETEKNRDTVPDYLSTINYYDAVSGYLTFEAVCDFLRQDSSRMDYLKDMIEAALKAIKSNLKLIINDESENIPYWIAAIMYAFPLSFAGKLTYSTYEYDPSYSDVLICGVAPNARTAYNASYAASSGMYYVFDFLSNTFNYSREGKKFLEIVETSYTYDKSGLEYLHGFADSLGAGITFDNIDAICDAYQMFNGNIDAYSCEEMRQSFEYVVSANPSYARDFFENVLDCVDDNDEILPEVASLVTKYAYEAFKGDPDYEFKLVRSVWRRARLYNYFYERYGVNSADTFLSEVMEANSAFAADIKEGLVNEDIVDDIADELRGDNDEIRNVFWGQKIFSLISDKKLSLSRFSNDYNAKLLMSIINNCVKLPNPVGSAMKIVDNQRLEHQMEFLALIKNNIGDANLKLEFDDRMLNLAKNAGNKTMILNLIAKVFTANYEYDIKNEAIKEVFKLDKYSYESLMEACETLKDDKAFWAESQSTVISSYFRVVNKSELSPKELSGLLSFLINNDGDDFTIQEVFSALDKKVSITDDKQNAKKLETYKNILAEIESRGVDILKTRMNIAIVVRSKLSERAFDTGEAYGLIEECNWSLLNDTEFKCVFLSIYQHVHVLLKQNGTLEKLHDAFIGDIERFVREYVECLTGNKKFSAESLVEFWLLIKNDDREYRALVDVLSDCKKKYIEEIFERLLMVVEKSYKSDKKALEHLYDDVIAKYQKKNPGFFKDLIGKFGRKND